MQGRGQKIFFSYSRDDSKFVLKLAEDMRAKELDLWIDQLDIPSGAHWDQTVEEALKSSPDFLIVLSPASIASQNVMDEVGYAIERKKKIIPILYRHCEIPFRINRLQYIDFTGDYGSALAKLLRALNAPSSNASEPLPAQQSFDRRFTDKKGLTGLLAIAGLAGPKARFFAGMLGIVVIGLSLYLLAPTMGANDARTQARVAPSATTPAQQVERETQSNMPVAQSGIAEEGASASPRPAAKPTVVKPEPTVLPASAPGPNLLALDQGGKLIAAPSDDWSVANDGDLKNSTLVLSRMGAVFGFKDDKPATFDRFGYLVLRAGDTPASIEIAAGDAPSGPFHTVGTVKLQDLKIIATDGWQYFKLPRTTARYVKITLGDSTRGAQGGLLTELGLYQGP